MKAVRIELEDEQYDQLMEKKQNATWRDLLLRGADIIDAQTVVTRRDLEFRLGNYMQQIDAKLTEWEQRMLSKGV